VQRRINDGFRHIYNPLREEDDNDGIFHPIIPEKETLVAGGLRKYNGGSDFLSHNSGFPKGSAYPTLLIN
jgi:hypothetical protein